ncbi:site-specific integrase [Pengzhenrongella frigida]|uniref:site-specific integrase n=1 Tax=Pengzhenrongella frigida TaxID=1259133 RepID=UPI0013E9A5FC|nr:tyrosine-type recombinase/integrase [Cellulomonas sp. HLT2-17]
MYFDDHTQRWVGQLDLGRDYTGKRHRPKVSGRTRAEARIKLLDLRAKHEAGVDLSSRSWNFADLTAAWLERGLPADLFENARSNYERMLTLHVVPVLGDIKLLELKSDHVEAMLDEMAEQNLAASSMRHALNLTRRVLRFAMLRDLVIRNVAEPVQTRRGPKAQRFGLTVDQAKGLLAAAATDRLANMLTLCLLLGLRPGEASALTWPHVKTDGDRPTITIAASLRRTPLGELVLVPPKTFTSRRTLEIPPPVVDALNKQRKLQAADAATAGQAWSNIHDLVFSTEVGTPLDPSNVRRTYNRIAKEAGIVHLHPHMLRHAAASLLSAAGVPIEDISDTLGHRSVAVTAEIYRHPIAPIRSGHMIAMNQLFDAPPEPKKAQPKRAKPAPTKTKAQPTKPRRPKPDGGVSDNGDRQPPAPVAKARSTSINNASPTSWTEPS